jgi:ribosome recycling factor
MQEIIKKCDDAMSKRIESLDKELTKVRTGRASVAIFDGIKVDYYGNPTPLNQVASLATPDPRSIVITPFEKSLIGDIERAIQMANLGLQPTNDGNVVRIPIPPLTEDRRKEIAKGIKKTGEDAKVGIRKCRQDANSSVKKAEKDKEISTDESKDFQKDIQDVTNKYIKVIDEKVAKKEDEVLKL